MSIICWILQAYMLVVFVYVVFAWVPQPPDPLRPIGRIVQRLVDPVVTPIRRFVPAVQMGGMALDVSILVLFFVLIILLSLVC